MSLNQIHEIQAVCFLGSIKYDQNHITFAFDGGTLFELFQKEDKNQIPQHLQPQNL